MVIPVYLCGTSCDMKVTKVLVEKYCFHVIEDASHAIGGKYNEQNGEITTAQSQYLVSIQ